jgi:hypothetical protein
MFLENEIWVWCPVKASFSMMKLHEFKFLRNSKLKFNNNKTQNTKPNGVNLQQPPPRPPPPSTIKNIFVINKFIEKLFEVENPFNLKHEIKIKKEITVDHLNDTNGHSNYNTDSDSDSYDDVADIDDDDLKNDSLSDTSSINSIKFSKRNGNGLESTKNGYNLPNQMKIPIVTNTTLNVIRLFGKYLHMLSTLEIISTDVINYMMQLFYFYFYYIYINLAKREVSKTFILCQ